MNSLGLDKAPADCRIAVAMSGGVDSSATAALLVEEGFDVFGVTLKLYDMAVAATSGTCCAGKDIRDAAKVCETLGIAHHVLDLEDVFKNEVIDAFADSYMVGETPIPCVNCNETVKFRDLLGFALDEGADLLVTGHYIRWRPGPQMWRGMDPVRDQSYFLYATTRQQLAKLRFPLGDLDKDRTRAHAARFNLAVADKPDSQDICFVPQGHYADIVAKLRPGAAEPGDIVDRNGTLLGTHKGLIHYTVGQRRGLGIGGGDPLYVLELQPERHRLVVGPPEALLTQEFPIRDINWLGDGEHAPKFFDCGVKVRSTQPPLAARITPTADGGARVHLAEPHAGIAPGQACVFYADERVLGGGWIRRASGT
ncbi:tRNA 2-thiouridine(34) synthase MnmA [Magnetospira sp. QH-2]|uniref:tRNA 2-thiouridine(34) synthase MnmA n=1 Tax=Magnetospira sp. (strain QH-2) TaxID=1288970 RepID=UPI0003E80C91|nr:tRNA 2-thiouridine(34) synthase MnmA [Magnetospira sp. QH-2]CCQ74489.1 tRNA (5-methylaminomethyl-2-thiouridylate)-methyltransferase [Magnetospira sp. QH-2]